MIGNENYVHNPQAKEKDKTMEEILLRIFWSWAKK